jgi:cation diffusion facilitator family transporter
MTGIPAPETRRESAKAGRSATLRAVVVNAFLVLFKLLCGVFGHSQALIADAAHSVSDLFTDVVVLIGLRIGRKAPDEKHHFGHARIETLASAIVAMALIGTALYLGIEAAWNIYRHTEHHPTWLALIGAGVSITLKEALYRYTVHVGRRIRSQLIVANAWHQRSDALSSVAVLLGVLGAQIHPSWGVLDSYAALIVSFFIIKVGLEILWSAVRELTDTAPQPETLARIRGCALSVDGVIGVHDLRARTLGGLFQMEMHIIVNGQQTVIEGHRIAKEVERCLEEEISGIDTIIVHVDPAIGERQPEKEEGSPEESGGTPSRI